MKHRGRRNEDRGPAGRSKGGKRDGPAVAGKRNRGGWQKVRRRKEEEIY